MDLNYSFLKDELALEEIRKHKWIESEKQKKEIGFATAAVDWVKKYGQSWKAFRFGLNLRDDIFTERRIHRRFSCQIPVQLKINDNLIMSYTDSVSLLGFSCVLPQVVPENSRVEIAIDFQCQDVFPAKLPFQFKGHVLKTTAIDRKPGVSSYKAFFLFDEEIKEYLRMNSFVLDAAR
jgi:hypothetical protein